MKALTAAEMREVDRLTTERLGVGQVQLMENAGSAVAEVVRDFARRWHRPFTRHVAVLCGKGNNGGDGFVAARHLTVGHYETRAYLFASPEELRGDCAANFQRWRESGGAVAIINSENDWDRIRDEVAWANVVVDALLGTGLRGGATGLLAKVIEDLNAISRDSTAANPLVVSVDTPSGLPSDGETAEGPVVRAHTTVTFTAAKIGQLVSKDAACCGHLTVRQIGSPPELVERIGQGSIRCAGPDEFALLPLARRPDAHKGSFGHVLVVGGSLGKSGAAVLAGYGSLCAGAGLTTVASPAAVQSLIASAHAEYMTEALGSTEAGTLTISGDECARFGKLLEGKTVLAVGPGLGTHPETQKAIEWLVRESAVPTVLDADGVNAFAGEIELLRERKTRFLTITPHPGEMARLLGTSNSAVQADRVGAASQAARLANAHVILKGFQTVLAAPDGRVWINTEGGPALAKGGTGDVLTGVLAALTAQFGTEDWLRVLALGVYLHGAAGQASLGYYDASGVVASSVAHSIPMARHALLQDIRFGR